MATSPIKDGIPEPSTIRPFLISRSYAIGFLRYRGSARFHSPQIISRRPNVAGLSYGRKGGSGMQRGGLCLDQAKAALDAVKAFAEAIDPKRHAGVIGVKDCDPAADFAQIGFQLGNVIADD